MYLINLIQMREFGKTEKKKNKTTAQIISDLFFFKIPKSYFSEESITYRYFKRARNRERKTIFDGRKIRRN